MADVPVVGAQLIFHKIGVAELGEIDERPFLVLVHDFEDAAFLALGLLALLVTLDLIDWYDQVQCHQQGQQTEREKGRIFKIVYKNQKWTLVNLAKLSDADLVKYQLSPNDWYVRHARRLLQERGPKPKVHKALLEILSGKWERPKSRDGRGTEATPTFDATRKLRALWTLHCAGGLTESIA